MKGNKLLWISLAAALLAVGLSMAWFSKKEKSLMESATPIDALVALKDIPQDARLDDTLIEVVKIPKRYVQPGAVSTKEDAFDRVLSVPVLAGTQILESMFKPADVGSLAKKAPAGFRAVSVSANEVSAVAGLIQPGDYVDVLLTVETGGVDAQGRERQEDAMTKTILQNALVLANNQTSSKQEFERHLSGGKIAGPGTTFAKADVESADKGKQIRTLTLALKPEDAQKVVLAQEIGSVSIALRSAMGQEKDTPAPPLSAKQLLGTDKNIVRKGPPAWVEIRGSQVINQH